MRTFQIEDDKKIINRKLLTLADIENASSKETLGIQI
jgi:hypothetical protein